MTKISKIDKMIEKNFKFEKDLLEANDAYNKYLTAQEDIENNENKNKGGRRGGHTIKCSSKFYANWMDNFNDSVNVVLERVNTEDALVLKEAITAAIEMGIILGHEHQFMEDCSEYVAETLAKAKAIKKSENK